MGHDGIRPAELLEQARTQLEPYETLSTVGSSVRAISKDDLLFTVEFKGRAPVRARTVLVATNFPISRE